ncbi:DEAD-box ATP-dependent RNA helicase CshA [Streptomyces alboniger]
MYRAHNMDKPEMVSRILQAEGRGLAMIFCRTKRTAADIAEQLEKRGFASGAVHGDLGQGAREQALRAFRNGKVDVLVCTDVAARGIDVGGVTHVINYQSPEDEKTYLHHGRPPRAGAKGIAITLVDWDDIPRWQLINKALDLGFSDPVETYSSSPHLYEELDIPAGTKGVLPRAERTRAGLGTEEIEDLGETGGRGRSGGGRKDRGRAAAPAPEQEQTSGAYAAAPPPYPAGSPAGHLGRAADHGGPEAAAPAATEPSEPRTPRRRRRTRGGGGAESVVPEAVAPEAVLPATVIPEAVVETAVVEAAVAAPVAEAPAAEKPKRRARKAAEPVAAETPAEEKPKRRARKAAEPVAEAEAPAEEKPKRRARKAAEPVAAEPVAAPTSAEEKPKRRARKAAEPVAAEASAEEKPKRRTRKAAEPVAAETPAEEKPKRRTRKAAEPVAEAEIPAQSSEEPKPPSPYAEGGCRSGDDGRGRGVRRGAASPYAQEGRARGDPGELDLRSTLVRIARPVPSGAGLSRVRRRPGEPLDRPATSRRIPLHPPARSPQELRDSRSLRMRESTPFCWLLALRLPSLTLTSGSSAIDCCSVVWMRRLAPSYQ